MWRGRLGIFMKELKQGFYPPYGLLCGVDSLGC